jgi:endonuclease IV
MKIGLKTFPRDFMLANRLHKETDYFELFAAQGEMENIKLFQGLDTPVHVIHAEHSTYGVNIANKEKYGLNMESIRFAQEVADMFGSMFIIVHPGTLENEFCSPDYSIEMLGELGDKRIITENLPFKGNFGGTWVETFGRTPAEISRIIESSGVGFCFDVGHAWSVAYATRRDPVRIVREFLGMKPAMFHFYDSVLESETETHLNMGDGDADIGMYKGMLPKDALITLETNPDYEKRRNDLRIMREGL